MLPIMTEALSGLVDQGTFALVSRSQQGFDTVESAGAQARFNASFQPIPARKLMAKPEGWRTWKWYTLWTTQPLEVGDYVRDASGIQLRVMSKNDWVRAGYFEYECAQASDLGSEAP